MGKGKVLNVSAARSKSDLLIIGGGPAGLSASIAGASEGLRVTVVEDNKFGGQAGTSTLIENYPGFPEVTGEELISRMVRQARKHGANLQLANITSLDRDGDCLVATDDEGIELYATTVLVASGVQYRRLRAENLDAYIGFGAEYGSPNIHTTYDNEEIFVVGGANSAGQAAYHLAQCKGCTIHLVVRAESLEKGMSSYLIKKIMRQVRSTDNPDGNIVIHLNTEVAAVDGDGKLETLWLKDKVGDALNEVPANRLFIMIGAIPKTQWLHGAAERDDHGFLLAGSDLPEDVRQKFLQVCDRPPLADETCQRGVFVIGDVRANTYRRVSSAVGGGQIVVASLFRYAEDLGL